MSTEAGAWWIWISCVLVLVLNRPSGHRLRPSSFWCLWLADWESFMSSAFTWSSPCSSDGSCLNCSDFTYRCQVDLTANWSSSWTHFALLLLVLGRSGLVLHFLLSFRCLSSRQVESHLRSLVCLGSQIWAHIWILACRIFWIRRSLEQTWLGLWAKVLGTVSRIYAESLFRSRHHRYLITFASECIRLGILGNRPWLSKSRAPLILRSVAHCVVRIVLSDNNWKR